MGEGIAELAPVCYRELIYKSNSLGESYQIGSYGAAQAQTWWYGRPWCEKPPSGARQGSYVVDMTYRPFF